MSIYSTDKKELNKVIESQKKAMPEKKKNNQTPVEEKSKAYREKYSTVNVARRTTSGLKLNFASRSPKPFEYDQITKQKRRLGLR